jgi:ribonucleotide monophosphatase NagD (HAD superfamily)
MEDISGSSCIIEPYVPSDAVQCRKSLVGDDIDADVGGAQQCGIRGILVRTGKYRQDAVIASSIVPDVTLDSIARLVQYLQ